MRTPESKSDAKVNCVEWPQETQKAHETRDPAEGGSLPTLTRFRTSLGRITSLCVIGVIRGFFRGGR